MKPKNYQKTFGQISVIDTEPLRTRGLWLCKCSCGTEKRIRGNDLLRGRIHSCGCLRKILVSSRVTTHGRSKTRTYKIWLGMKKRCLNKNVKQYKDYGGRGINVCPEWKTSFDAFLKDMGNAPKGKTIERVNNDLGYSKENCVWLPKKEQSKNTRRTQHVEYNGKIFITEDLAKELGISGPTLKHRIKFWDKKDWGNPIMQRGKRYG
jgi:hypothetical protein